MARMKSAKSKEAFAALVCAAALCALLAGCGRGAAPAREGAATPQGRHSPTAAQPGATPALDAGASANALPSATPGGDLTERDDTSADDFEGTAAATEKERKNAPPAVLAAVRTARHPNFDRVVFEFQGPAVPGYLVEYVDKPVRRCGSGAEVPLAGDAWLRVRLTPALAHTEAGEATVQERSRRPGYENLKELVAVCDFEGEVEWVLALASPNRYRAVELKSPARLVIDVKTARR